jgi:soluble lytic murein transglycosylase
MSRVRAFPRFFCCLHSGRRGPAQVRHGTCRGAAAALVGIALSAAAFAATAQTATRVQTPAPAPSLAPAPLLAPPLAPPAASATPSAARDDAPVLDARDAFRRKDAARLALDSAQAIADHHPLAPWVDYWALNARLSDATVADVEAFYVRWPGTYVEDRLRNDWLLELGRRLDWTDFARDYPRFKMDDDREVNCYVLLIDHLAGRRSGADLRDAARRAWTDQRDADNGCQLMAQTLYDDKVFDRGDVFRKLRQTAEGGRLKAMRAAAAIIGPEMAQGAAQLQDNPARYLARKAIALGPEQTELVALAIARLAANDPDAAARQLTDRWERPLGAERAAWAWSVTARLGAIALSADALDDARKAWASLRSAERDRPDWSDDTLGWLARAALRLGQGAERWTLTLRAIDAMSPAEQAEPTWVYWRARAQLGLAPSGRAGDAQRADARQALGSIAGQLNFYGQLASEDTGGPQALPPRTAPPTRAEQGDALALPGIQRALLLFSLGLRSEAVREWNFTLIGMGDRQLLAAAQVACDREIWDRCINTSDRTRVEIDMVQRFPTPLRSQVLAKAQQIGLDPAYVYGLIRQESRFIMDARSGAGAHGLMQIMPATAKLTARKLGVDFDPQTLTDRDTNLTLGTAYLKMALDNFDGSQALAAAAYNAGPGRPQRWRIGPPLEAAIWAENIPFNETRDYVKKVLSNATYYAGLLAGKPASLKARLGGLIGPLDGSASASNAGVPADAGPAGAPDPAGSPPPRSELVREDTSGATGRPNPP